MSDLPESFPQTSFSIVENIRSDEETLRTRAMDTLANNYWKPVYKYARIKWNLSPEDAEDATQGFFSLAFEKRYFDSYDPSIARFRTFIRMCVDRYISKEREAASRKKRGGGAVHLSLDFAGAERELPVSGKSTSPDEIFHREWVRSIFAAALNDLEGYCGEKRAAQFSIFLEYDVKPAAGEEKPTYAELARTHDTSETQVTNYLHAMRKKFREFIVSRTAAQSGNESEFRRDLAELLGG